MTDRRPQGTILVVDDQVDLRRLLTLALQRSDFEVVDVGSGEEAMDVLSTQPIDVLVLDMGLPGMHGTAVVQALRERPETATLPILLMTGSGTDQSVIEGLEAGADDFLAKPVRLDELVARVRAHLRSRQAWSGIVEDELRVRMGVVGTLGQMALSTEPEAAAEAVVGELAGRTDNAFVEVLQLAAGERLQPLASYTAATGVVRGGPPPDPRRARFLHDRARQGPWVARPGRRATDHESPIWNLDLALVAGAPIYSSDEVVGLLIIGVADAPQTFHDRPAKLMAAAIDYASILTAVAGPALGGRREAGAERSRLLAELKARAFHPVFQPIVDLEGRQVVGYEALTRFDDGTPPNIRFADAARLGLSEDYELAAAEVALLASARLPGEAFVSFNVSPAVALEARERLRRHVQSAPRAVVLELTEHAPIFDYGSLRDAISSLGNVQVAVDDAGAGYASLRHILELQPAFAKLDLSLVRGIDADPLRQAMAAGIQYYALRTGCRLVAEGVETEQEANTLRDLGVDLGQGYLFGRPEALSA